MGIRYGWKLLTFLSRVLRSVVVVAVAHKLHTVPLAKATTTEIAPRAVTTTPSSILPDSCFQPKQRRIACSAFGRLSFVTHLLFLSFAGSFFLLVLPSSVLVVAATVVVNPAPAIALCAVRTMLVDESVSLRILHEADASNCRCR